MTIRDLVPSFGKKKVPVRYNDHPLSMLHGEMDRLFEDFFRGYDLEPFREMGAFNPSVEVSENEKEIKVSAELPGLDENDIDLSLTHDTLTISGEKKEEKESTKEGYFMKERSYGSFKRSIPLYTEIKADKVDAHFKKGVLTVTLPKSEKELEKKKKIKINTN